LWGGIAILLWLQMAVPKQKQSSARRDKRRAQHKISAPTYNECPQCHSPRLPHRVCPVCGFYGKRQVMQPASSTTEEEQSQQSP
jgi:large subunit ribosomal protein L32